MSAYWSALLYLNKHNNKCWSAHGSGADMKINFRKLLMFLVLVYISEYYCTT